ncbi:hypothetical protein ACTXT7_002376 [Hymenolepis weldensis]
MENCVIKTYLLMPQFLRWRFLGTGLCFRLGHYLLVFIRTSHRVVLTFSYLMDILMKSFQVHIFHTFLLRREARSICESALIKIMKSENKPNKMLDIRLRKQ